MYFYFIPKFSIDMYKSSIDSEIGHNTITSPYLLGIFHLFEGMVLAI